MSKKHSESDRPQSQINYKRLRKARGDRAISEVAAQAEVSYQTLWYIERGLRQPSIPLLQRLCAIYDISPAKILAI